VKPALSVIVFTVLSGAGLGLLICTVLARLAGEAAGGVWRAAVLAIVLLSVGLVSSSLHLANPRNAWRAFARFATSWLSREAVFAALLYPLVAVWLFAIARDARGLEVVAGVASIAFALLVLLSTAMIYACLKTVPQWNTWHTVIGYPLYGLMSGALLWLAVAGPDDATAAAWNALACGLLVAGLVLKLVTWLRFTRPVGTPSADAALNLPAGRVRMLDPGHSRGTFLTNEFIFEVARARGRVLRWTALAAGYALPLGLLLSTSSGRPPLPVAVAAALCCIAGLLVERWLFFAEARHAVRVWHGATGMTRA
jgi:DMSO reductase anchor subunit